MTDKKIISEDLLLDILQEGETAIQTTAYDDSAREELEELLALYHLSVLHENETSRELQPVPEYLCKTIQQQGEAYLARQDSYNKVLPMHKSANSNLPLPQRMAMAACLLVAMIAWYPRIIEQMRAPEPISETASHFAEQANTLSISWQSTGDPASTQAKGAILWNQDQQAGYIRFKGLAANDPDEYQYQLWIFDKSRDADNGHPVDGGVFDIKDSNAETILPVDAKLKVGKPYLFAVTIEKPGGVVVSDQQRIVVIARAGV